MLISDSSGISKMRRMLIIFVALDVVALVALAALVVVALVVAALVVVALVALVALAFGLSRRLCLHDGHVLFNRSQ